ncbi:MAG: hypothetical protein OEV43_05570, partial [Coriobacteriia bacterium]|nr:hypothetical protein [Coriobacteriia bacterium]
TRWTLSWRWTLACAGAGAIGVTFLAAVGWVSWVSPGAMARWADLGGHGFAVALAALGGYVVAAGVLFEQKHAAYAGVFIVLTAYWVEAATLEVETIEYFTTPLGAYLIWFGYRWASQAVGRSVPVATDVAAMVVALGVPTLLAADPVADRGPWTHLVWATALAVAAITAGVLLRVRAYFFGGIAAIVLVGFVRSFIYLAQYWWLVLGVIGTLMLVVALTWERQRMIIAETGRRFRDSLVGWR